MEETGEDEVFQDAQDAQGAGQGPSPGEGGAEARQSRASAKSPKKAVQTTTKVEDILDELSRGLNELEKSHLTPMLLEIATSTMQEYIDFKQALADAGRTRSQSGGSLPDTLRIQHMEDILRRSRRRAKDLIKSYREQRGGRSTTGGQ